MDKTIYTLYKVLFGVYGHQNWWPIIENGRCRYLDDYRKRARTDDEILEIMAGAVLTQNTSWENAAGALAKLKGEALLNIESLDSVRAVDIAKIIKGSGYYNQKAAKLKALAGFLKGLPGGMLEIREMGLEAARECLLSVWGIGKETADSILLYGFYFLTFVIDSYTVRVFSRVWIGENEAPGDYEKIRCYVMERLPRNTLLYQDYHALIVLLGKNICRKTPLCEICPLSFMCGYAHGRTALRTI